MKNCYAEKATFNDPVFQNLNATQVRAMWEMFCVKSKDLKIEFKNIRADQQNGGAEWTATYVFSLTGKKVVNHIIASFILENGKIVNHKDTFNFYNWARQALGLSGVILGWTPLVKNKVRKEAMNSLNNFIGGNK